MACRCMAAWDFVEETGAAQFMRDVRIAAIYEGTNGIQAIDLVQRKLPQSGGATMTRRNRKHARHCRTRARDERNIAFGRMGS